MTWGVPILLLFVVMKASYTFQIIQKLNAFVGLQGSPSPMFFFSQISQTSLGDPTILHLQALILWFSYVPFYHFFFCISSIIPPWHFFSNYIFLLNSIFVSWIASYISLSSSFLLSWHIFISFFSCLNIVIITILHSFSGRSFRGFTTVELERGRSWIGFSCYFFFPALELAHLKLCICWIFVPFCSNFCFQCVSVQNSRGNLV